MATDTNHLTEAVETIRDAMREFHSAMRFRDALTLKIGKRTTQIIRFGMIAMILITASMFYLIYTLTSSMSDITKRMNTTSSPWPKIWKPCKRRSKR
jgi:hypothetical protein